MKNRTETRDLDYFIFFVKNHWIIIAINLLIFLSGAYLVNKYSSKVYNVSTSIVINEESGGFADASAQILNELGFVSTNKSFANELLTLQSTPLIKDAIRKLDFQISYFEHELFTNRELYKSSPFIVIIDKNFPQPIGVEFFIKVIDSENFEISVNDKDVKVYSYVTNDVMQELNLLNFSMILKFDNYLYNDHMKFKILLNSSVDIEDLIGKKYSFYLNTEGSLVKYYKARLEVLPQDLEATIAAISIEARNTEKAVDFLNALTDSYLNSELDKKRTTSIKTIEYINDQLKIVGDSLERAEQKLQSFRTQNEVTDISLQSGKFIDEMHELESQKAILDVNTKYYEYVKNFFKTNVRFDELIAPSAMGIDDPMLNNLIEELIRLNGERASFIENNQEKSPYLKKINIRIENLRKMVSENISYYEETNSIKVVDIDARINRLNKEIRKLPATQRALVGIERKFNINDNIYSYLLEKRAEAEIAKTSYQADAEVLEPAAIVGSYPISPKKNMNYVIGFILGILIPVVIIRIKELTRTSFVSLSEAENAIELPVVGKIFHKNKDCENIVELYPQTRVAENFRQLLVGLKFFFKKTHCKTILISSSIGGEGKSFIALNSAITIANSGFKTVLLSFDLRKNKLNDFLLSYNGNENRMGFTDYICGQFDSQEIIHRTSIENFDFILSGGLAPNPGQLISSEYTNILFKELKDKYEYIIIDSSPIGIVSDAYYFMNYCDLNVIVVRLNTTPKTEFKALQNDMKNKELNSCVIINDISRQYSNGYGYYMEN